MSFSRDLNLVEIVVRCFVLLSYGVRTGTQPLYVGVGRSEGVTFPHLPGLRRVERGRESNKKLLATVLYVALVASIVVSHQSIIR